MTRLLTLALLAAAAAPAAAQSIGDAQPGFWITPAVRTSAVREDNVVFTSGQRTGVTFLRVTPTVDVTLRNERSTVDLTYGFDSERHPDTYRTFNNAFARHAGGGAFETRLTPRLLLTGRARYISTVRPEEALEDTGLVSERRRTTAYAGDVGFDRDLTTRLVWHAGYGISAEDFGEPQDSRPSARSTLHAVSTDVGFRVAPRTLLAAVYTGRLAVGDDIRVRATAHGEFAAHLVAARLTRTLTPSLTAVVMAGPRYSQGPPDLIPREGPAPLETTLAPEVLASLTWRQRGNRISGAYRRSQFIGYGAAGFVDTESVELRAGALIGPRLQLSTRPAVYRNTLADVQAIAYRADIAAGLQITRFLRFDASYLYRHQDRTLTLADTVEPGPLKPRTRRTIFVGLTLSHAARLDEHQ
jgi:hypothetical protein